MQIFQFVFQMSPLIAFESAFKQCEHKIKSFTINDMQNFHSQHFYGSYYDTRLLLQSLKPMAV